MNFRLTTHWVMNGMGVPCVPTPTALKISLFTVQLSLQPWQLEQLDHL